MITAVLGAGYTGSYIFSQTIFTMKSGIKSNLSGLVIATVELAVFALPFSVVRVCGERQGQAGEGQGEVRMWKTCISKSMDTNQRPCDCNCGAGGVCSALFSGACVRCWAVSGKGRGGRSRNVA